MGQKRKNVHNNNPQNESRASQQGTREQDQRQAPAGQGGSKLEQKLEELQSEWTLERIKEVASAAVVIIGVFLSVKNRKKLEEAGQKVASILGVENLRDWTPPEGLLNMLGIRRQEEVDKEVEKLYSRLA